MGRNSFTMKNRQRFATATLLFLAWTSCAVSTVMADVKPEIAGNIVVNGGFEENIGGKPAGWSPTQAKGEETPVSIDSEITHSGKAALRIRHKNNESYSSARLVMPVKPDTKYTATVWVKGDNITPAANGSSGAARLYLEKPENLGTLIASTPMTGSFDWKKVTLEFNSGPRTTVPVILYLHRASGTVWYDDLVVTPETGIPFIEVFPVNLPTGILVISPDMNASFALNMRHNLPGTIAGGSIEAKKMHNIVFDLPEGVELSAASIGKIAGPPAAVERNGQKYFRYMVEADLIHHQASWSRNFYFHTSLPSESERTAYYWVQWDNGKQPEQSLRLKVVSTGIGKTPCPRRLITGSYGLTPDIVIKTFPDWESRLRDFGVNTISVGFSNDFEFMRKARAAGFFLRKGDYYFVGGPAAFHKWTEQDEQARALGLDGNPVKIENGKYLQMCPSYRGKLFREGLEKDREWLRQAQVNWLAFDMEGTIFPDAGKICYCNRCMDKFRAYLAERQPELPYLSPKVFEREIEKYPKYHTAWVDFKCSLWTDFFAEIKNSLAQAVTQSCPKSGVVLSEWTEFLLSNYDRCRERAKIWEEASRNKSLYSRSWLEQFGYLEVHAYSSVQSFVTEMKQLLENMETYFPGLRIDWIVTPCPARLTVYRPEEWPFASKDIIQPAELKYKIFEAAAFGAKGIYAWPYVYFTPQSFKYWVDGIRAVVKVEDIVLDGQRIRNITSTNPAIWPHGMELGDEAIIVAAEYLTREPAEAEIAYVPKKDSEVVDLETDEIIARTSVANPSFKVNITPDRRARFLHIRPVKK